MINIAIVDNEKSVLENIREILLNLSGEFKDVHIDTYEKAENFSLNPLDNCLALPNVRCIRGCNGIHRPDSRL